MTARLVAAIVAVALLGACSADEEPPSAAPTLGPTAACAAAERPPLQEGSHLIGDTPPPVPYSSVPPTSGWHASGATAAQGVYGAQLPDPQLVSVLEQGRVVVTHTSDLSTDGRDVAAELTTTLPGVVVAPYDVDDAAFTYLAWGALQRCDTLVLDDVLRFADAFGGVDREP